MGRHSGSGGLPAAARGDAARLHAASSGRNACPERNGNQRKRGRDIRRGKRSRRAKWLEIGNGAEQAEEGLDFEIQAPDWIGLSQKRGTVRTEARVLITAEDAGRNREGTIRVENRTDGGALEIPVRIAAPLTGEAFSADRAVPTEDGGLVCVEADSAEKSLPASASSQERAAAGEIWWNAAFPDRRRESRQSLCAIRSVW